MAEKEKKNYKIENHGFGILTITADAIYRGTPIHELQEGLTAVRRKHNVLNCIPINNDSGTFAYSVIIEGEYKEEE